MSRSYLLCGVAFVGVAFLTSRDDGTACLKQFGILHPCRVDDTLSIAPAYDITGIPLTLVLDQQSIVRQEYAGPIPRRRCGRHSTRV